MKTMSVKQFLRIRKTIENLRDELKKISEEEMKKGKYRFFPFVLIGSNRFDACINKLDLLDDYEQTDWSIGDVIMTELYTENPDEDDPYRQDELYVNERVKEIMIRFHLLRNEDRRRWNVL